jgi:integrase
VDIALLTGLRRGDILKSTRDSITDTGLRVETSRTDKPLLFAMTVEFKAALYRALAEQPKVRRFLICNKQGIGYSADGFSTLWNRARKKALKAKKLATPFAFNDIRAKSASDDENADRASQRLGHTNRQTTERYYIRTPRKVSPLR